MVEDTIKKYPLWIQSQIKLSIGILVSNNIETIRRCLASLKPLLDNIPSELIIVDTVGEENSDGSLNVAKTYTDKIYHFDWCDDFAAARNVCIDHAEGEWFLFVDDDEWFDDVQEIIDFFTTEEYKEYCQGVYHIRNYSADGKYTLALVSRFFRRTSSLRFVGKVHETVNEVYLPKKKFSLYANHSGYAFRNEQEKVKKQRRNISILEKEIKERGLTSAYAAQMVQELLSSEKTVEDGYRVCRKYMDELKTAGQLTNPSGQWLLVASARYFPIVKKYDELFRWADYLQENYTLSQMAELALALTVIFPAVECDRMDLAKKYAEQYVAAWDWLNAHEADALQQFQLDFSEFYTEEYYHKVVYIAAVTANCMKDYRLANQYWNRLPWKREGFDGSKYARDMQITINGLKRIQKWKQTEELLQMLGQAQVILEGKVQNKSLTDIEKDEIKELLQCMQETSIAIGRNVDELVGKGTELVIKLEAFCDLMRQFKLNEEQALTGNILIRMKRYWDDISKVYAELAI